MLLMIYTDGGSSGNPGRAAFAYVFSLDGLVILKHSERVGLATNNFAEYAGLFSSLEKALQLIKNQKIVVNKITVFSDSNLMINQVNGLFKVKNGKIRDFIMKIRVLEGEIKVPVVYQHIPREKNQLADSLVKKTLYS